ncbi:dihydropteroate synthase [Algimonas porphyrae]|uniref:Methyltetrahydrofolate--corrinoid methyltransferase n=1 Tax=Algimonas porphyrae TaxID=1128113 RepID=A0ABQ5UZY0_9PROT|nr:dihydropteroate synthase [Algimonas porphyrae]GLQ19926.1 methyltetrahydrofolate--corrinoid methyltransferase [Algimonas porphyrae]
MARTILASPTQEVVIGFDQPFVMIGERINPTNRPKFAAELKDGNYWRVVKEAQKQIEAGAQLLDVNVGVPLTDEAKIMSEVITLLQGQVETPLVIDSSVKPALESGLAAYQGRPLVNSVTGEEDSLEFVLPLIKKYDCAVVAISNDDTGISEDPDERFEVAKRIVHRAADYGIKADDVVVDPLVMPVGAVNSAGKDVFRLVRRLRDELGVNTTCGASNVAFGLPNRHAVHNAFLPMLQAAGMTSAILNVYDDGLVPAIKAGDMLAGNDPDCTNWIAINRPKPVPGEGGRRGGSRRGGRRRG